MTSCAYTLSDVCVPVTVTVEQTTFSVDGGWVAGAFLLGLLIGAVLAALLVRPCLREWQKKKRQDEEDIVKVSAATAPVITAEPAITHKVVKEKSRKKKGSRFRRKKKEEVNEDDDEDNVEVEHGKFRGMVDVVVQISSTEAEEEMAKQDMENVTIMDKEYEDEKEFLFLRCLDSLMKKLVVKGAVPEDFYMTFMKQTNHDFDHIKTITNAEIQQAQEEARKDNKLSKDPQALEEALLTIENRSNNKLSEHRREYREKMRRDLIRSSGISEAEVDALLEKLMGQMAALEAKLGMEQARQRKNLEERLAKRRQVLEYNEMQAGNQTEDLQAHVHLIDTILSGLQSSGKLNPTQQEELLKQYQDEVEAVRKHYNTERLRQQQSLAEKLQQRRNRELHKLSTRHTKEKAEFLHTSEKGVGTTDMIQSYHELVVRQHQEMEETNTDLDQTDVQEIDQLNKGLYSQEQAEVEQKLAVQMADVGNVANLSSSDVNRILKQHHQQMERYHIQQSSSEATGEKQRERQAMLARLQQRLAHRLQVVEEGEKEGELQMDSLRQQQTATLSKVLASNIELSQQAKDRILREHEQNMQSVTNQLQRSKLRQQKSLEVKLSARHARVEAVRVRQAEMREQQQHMKQKEWNKLEKQLANELASEEEKLAAARQAAVDSLKQQLAAETEEALRLQDQEIGVLIGRLQVGQARRQAILKKQDKTLKELQDQLEERMTEGELPRSYTDQLLQQHHNQMQHLNQHIQRSRTKQEQLIMEKIQTKKHMRQNQLEQQMEEEAQVQYYEQQQRRAGLASSVLLQTLLDQRHQRVMAELETEMKAELERSKEELNSTLELELHQELQSQKQQFLSQLAAISGMSQEELHQAVDAAVTETGVDNDRAKKLAKDLRLGIKRAKTDLSETFGTELQQTSGSQRPGSRLDNISYASDELQTELNRPKKKKKRKGLQPHREPKPAFTTYNDEDDGDDDF